MQVCTSVSLFILTRYLPGQEREVDHDQVIYANTSMLGNSADITSFWVQYVLERYWTESVAEPAAALTGVKFLIKHIYMGQYANFVVYF